MTRRPAIPTAAPSLVVSHGADFFGEDRHPLSEVTSLAPWVANSVAAADRQAVTALVSAMERLEDQNFPPATAASFAEHLLKVSRDRYLKPKASALARALADAAARAATDGEPWIWTVNTVRLASA